MVKRLNETVVRTEKEIDKLYSGKWVLLDDRAFPYDGKGCIVALGEDSDEDLDELLSIKLDEYKGEFHLMVGCPTNATRIKIILTKNMSM
ncbi:MAG: hypothetical protein FWC16_09065 [Defluviitaleaceae bacterium]|nr:hypothetical protein [Defluviitaleaceae bacterium]MCL2275060.1 hypothetical protein [Defluviitaleaceae bacterium]